jgi:cobalt/nickel transport system permease protein
MTRVLDPPAFVASPLSRLDPRWKLASLMLAAVFAGMVATLPAAAAAWLASWVLVGFSRMPLGWYLGRLATLGVVLLVFVLLLPFVLSDGGPSLELGGVEISLYGLRVALVLCLKALTIVTLMLVLLVSAPLDATLKAAHDLHFPGLLIQIAALTYRYLFLLADELARLLVALRVRGYRLRAHRRRFRMIGHVAGTVLVRGYERAERVGQAMRCRGFDGRFRSLARFATRPVDVLASGLILAAAGGLLFWDFLQR